MHTTVSVPCYSSPGEWRRYDTKRHGAVLTPCSYCPQASLVPVGILPLHWKCSCPAQPTHPSPVTVSAVGVAAAAAAARCVKPHRTLTLLLDLRTHAHGRSLVLDTNLHPKTPARPTQRPKCIRMHGLVLRVVVLTRHNCSTLLHNRVGLGRVHVLPLDVTSPADLLVDVSSHNSSTTWSGRSPTTWLLSPHGLAVSTGCAPQPAGLITPGLCSSTAYTDQPRCCQQLSPTCSIYSRPNSLPTGMRHKLLA